MDRVSFADVTMDLRRLEIRNGGELVQVEPQVFAVLCFLIENRDRVVTKEELLDGVWGDRFVSESALTSRIKSVRRAVGDDGKRQHIVRTVHGRGYQFIAECLVDGDGDDDDDVDGVAEDSQLAGANPPRSVRAPTVDGPNKATIGRDGLVADVRGRLEAGALVTMVGPAGVGKTHVARCERHLGPVMALPGRG